MCIKKIYILKLILYFSSFLNIKINPKLPFKPHWVIFVILVKTVASKRSWFLLQFHRQITFFAALLCYFKHFSITFNLFSFFYNKNLLGYFIWIIAFHFRIFEGMNIPFCSFITIKFNLLIDVGINPYYYKIKLQKYILRKIIVKKKYVYDCLSIH